MGNDVKSELSAMKICVERIENILKRNDDDFRMALILLRKELSGYIFRVQALLQGEGASFDQSVARALRTELSSARSKLALHQAAWPAVKIDEDIEGYRRSSQAATEELLHFLRAAEHL